MTAYDQPALGGVYKLGAVRDTRGAWREAIKLSEQPIKISNPGNLQVRRLRRGGELVADLLYDSEHGLAGTALYDIEEPLRPPQTIAHDSADDLLRTMLANGDYVGERETLEHARARCAADLASLSARSKRFLNPQPHPVGLDAHVHARKLALIAEARAKRGAA